MATTDPTMPVQLVLELTGASLVMDDEEFDTYAADRLAPLLGHHENAEALFETITLAITMSASSIKCWAEDTNRTPVSIMNAITGSMGEKTGI